MPKYSDSSRLVFERALGALVGQVPEDFAESLQTLLYEERLDDVEAIRALIEAERSPGTVSQSDTDAG